MVKLCIRSLVLLLVVGAGEAGGGAKNVILLIGDGMGFEQVRAAGMYANGKEGSLFMESLEHKGQMTTGAADSAVTDSAASATAMATGVKVNNGVVSVAIPGDGRELVTVLELFQAANRKCGLVTTVPLTHATPACFGAHEKSRGNADEIGQDYLTQSRPAVLFGGGKPGLSVEQAKEAGYRVVQNREEMLTVLEPPGGCNCEGCKAKRAALWAEEKNKPIMGLFDPNYPPLEEGGLPYEVDGVGAMPHLSEMTRVALDVLEKNEMGFFLMVEGGKIDWSGHVNDLARNIGETVEFDRAVRMVCDWAKGREDTLVVVTADHETGGLKVLENKGKGNEPVVNWGTKGHTDVPVPVYALGFGGESFSEKIDNTDIFTKIVSISAVGFVLSK
jgi:alkaline phosphatase